MSDLAKGASSYAELKPDPGLDEQAVEVVPKKVQVKSEPCLSKVDKDDPRARLHYIKYLRGEAGKTIKLWECGICRKDFKHQFALVKHLPTHTGNL